mgnify:CR=1 FL=1
MCHNFVSDKCPNADKIGHFLAPTNNLKQIWNSRNWFLNSQLIHLCKPRWSNPICFLRRFSYSYDGNSITIQFYCADKPQMTTIDIFSKSDCNHHSENLVCNVCWGLFRREAPNFREVSIIMFWSVEQILYFERKNDVKHRFLNKNQRESPGFVIVFKWKSSEILFCKPSKTFIETSAFDQCFF